jgi:hypothetical protein
LISFLYAERKLRRNRRDEDDEKQDANETGERFAHNVFGKKEE